jgi:hypothetical protein
MMGKCPKHVETLNLNKVIVKVKYVSRWLCLLRNYVTMIHGQQNIKTSEMILDSICNNALHDLTLTDISVTHFVGTECFVIRYSKDHTK